MVQHVLLGDIAPLLILLGLSRVIMRPATRRLSSDRAPARPVGQPGHRHRRVAGADVPLAHPGALRRGGRAPARPPARARLVLRGRGGALVAADPARADAPPAHRHAAGRLHRHRQGRPRRARHLPHLEHDGDLPLLRGHAADLGPEPGRGPERGRRDHDGRAVADARARARRAVRADAPAERARAAAARAARGAGRGARRPGRDGPRRAQERSPAPSSTSPSATDSGPASRTTPRTTTSRPNVTSPSTSSLRHSRSDGAPPGKRASKSASSL